MSEPTWAMTECTCPFRATNRHEYGCELRLDCADGMLCAACDLPITHDEDGEHNDDETCLRVKSYCTNKHAHVDWRKRALEAEARSKRLSEVASIVSRKGIKWLPVECADGTGWVRIQYRHSLSLIQDLGVLLQEASVEEKGGGDAG